MDRSRRHGHRTAGNNGYGVSLVTVAHGRQSDHSVRACHLICICLPATRQCVCKTRNSESGVGSTQLVGVRSTRGALAVCVNNNIGRGTSDDELFNILADFQAEHGTWHSCHDCAVGSSSTNCCHNRHADNGSRPAESIKQHGLDKHH